MLLKQEAEERARQDAEEKARKEREEQRRLDRELEEHRRKEEKERSERERSERAIRGAVKGVRGTRASMRGASSRGGGGGKSCFLLLYDCFVEPACTASNTVTSRGVPKRPSSVAGGSAIPRASNRPT